MVEKIRVGGMKERQKLNKLGIGKEITNNLSGKEASGLAKSLLQSKGRGGKMAQS